ncbi:MAG: LTA synthase family protein [Flavobacteriales bacterium]|nr:LTA synthase family protein [Flavobacteriales bacterium]MCB9363290.1 LTA synthase family protein [Flavobacteriales bacterium]
MFKFCTILGRKELIYLFAFGFSFCTYFLLLLDLPITNGSLLEKSISSILILDNFIFSLLAIFSVSFLLSQFHNKWIKGITLFMVILFVTINTFQLINYSISGEFFTRLALDNIEFIEFLFTVDNFIIIGKVTLAMLGFPLLITWLLEGKCAFSTKKLMYYMLVLGLFIFACKIWAPNHLKEMRTELLINNSLKDEAPVVSFLKVFFDKKASKTSFIWSKSELERLKLYGFNFKPFSKFPFLKESIYKGGRPFELAEDVKPNVLLIFTEGLSARTTDVYSDRYEKLTPNLLEFSKSSMIVDNFYNHTAATYRGLHGQLCSLYPTLGGAGGWHDNIESIPDTKYKSITEIFKHNGYTTTFLNPHWKDVSGNDEMMKMLAFDKVLNGEDLVSKKYGENIGKRDLGTTDHGLYNGLIQELKKMEKNNTFPFMMAMYSYETHAWKDVVEDGVKYKDGENSALNTIYNMDHSFGKFWNYFKNSPLAKNTIVIFTSDHAHYHEEEYLKLMKEHEEDDYQKLFIDEVPLIVYSPKMDLPNHFDAKYATSIDLTPSLIHFLGFPNEWNSFIGSSIFEKSRLHNTGVASYDNSYYVIDNEKIHNLHSTKKYQEDGELLIKFIEYTHYLESNNQFMPKDIIGKNLKHK